MRNYRIIICHNVADRETFKVEAMDKIPEMYRNNFYHYKIYVRYNPQENNVVDEEIIKEMCYLEIAETLSLNNLWEKETGFYLVDFKTYRQDNYLENSNNSSIESLASDFEINWDEFRQDDDDHYDEDDFLSDDSGYGTPSASSTIISNEGDLDFSSFNDDEDF
ncbi:unnamed protein product [Diamesa serratosioi]